jgi:hypothetical protein
MNQSRRLLSLGFCLVLYTAVQIHAQPQYTVTDLGAIWVSDVNNSGTVVGSTLSGGQAPVIWVNGLLVLLVAPSGWGRIDAINNEGEMVGYVGDEFGRQHAAYWAPNGTLILLPGISTASAATMINGVHQMAGYGDQTDGTIRAKRWYADGTTDEALPTLGGLHSWGSAIDGQGRVWGNAQALNGNSHVVRWDVDGTIVDYGSLGGWTVLYRVNASGVGVGNGTTGQGQSLPFRTTATGLAVLPVLPSPFFGGSVSAINNAMLSVGSCWAPGPTDYWSDDVEHATLWHEDGTATDLNSLIQPTSGWILNIAKGISENGLIVGTGQLHGQTRAFLLTPVPAAPPSLAIYLNESDVAPGQTLRAALEMHNPGPLLTTDVYALVLLPDGDRAVFLTNLSPTEGVIRSLGRDDPRTFPRLLADVSWPSNLHTTQQDAWVYRRSGLEADGTYHLIVAWTKPNSLQDGSIDEGDILALDWKAFRFMGPASTLTAKAQEIRARHATK